MKENKNIFVLIIMILLLLIAGTSFALYKVLLEPSNEQEAKISKIKVSYIEPDYKVSSTKMSDEMGKTQNNYYEFTLHNETEFNMNMNYYIYLNKLDQSNIDSKYIKVYLTDSDDNPVGRFRDNSSSLYLNSQDTNNSEGLTNVIDKQCISIKNGNIKECNTNNDRNEMKYRLRFWISDEFEVEPTTTNNGKIHTTETIEYMFKFKVNVLISET